MCVHVMNRVREVKNELKSVEEDDCELTRTATPPIFNGEPEPESVVEEDVGLSRQMSNAPKVSVA